MSWLDLKLKKAQPTFASVANREFRESEFIPYAPATMMKIRF